MAEEIDLGSLNFDTDKLAKSILDVRVKLDEMRNSLTENRKAMRGSQKAVEDLEAIQSKMTDTNSKGYKKLSEEIKKSKEDQVEYTKAIIQQEAEVRTLSKEQQTLTKVLDANSRATDSNTDSIDRAVKASQEEVKTIDQARASNTQLLKLRNELDISGGKNADKLEELNKALNANNKFIKENVSEYEQQKIGIGDYQNAIEGALGGTRLFGVSMKDVKGTAQQFSGVFSLLKKEVTDATSALKGNTAATEGMSGAQKMGFITTQSLSAALKLLRLALIATGIGAIVVVLGSLITYLSTTQAGIDAVTSVTRPLSAVFQTLLGIIQQFGGDIFKNPLKSLKTMKDFVQKQLIGTFGSLGKIIKGAFTLDGDLIKEGMAQYDQLAKDNTEMLKDMARGIGNQFSEAWEKGKQIDKLQKQQEELEATIASRRAQGVLDLAKQEKIYLDQTLSMEERNAAAEESRRITLAMQDDENEILDLQIQQLQIRQSLNDSSREDNKQLDELIAKRIESAKKVEELDKKTLRLKKQMQNEQKAIDKANEEAYQASLDAALKLQQVELDTFVKLNKGRQQSLDEELEFAREVSAKRLDILNKEFKQGKRSKQEYELAKLLLAEEAQKEEADVVLFYAQQRINDELIQLERLRSERKRISEDSMQDEIGAINALNQLRAADLKTQLDANLISQRDYNQALAQLEVDKNAQIDEVNAEWNAQRLEDEKMSRLLENEQRLLDLTDTLVLEREIERQAYEEKQEELEQQRTDGLISEENYLTALEQLNEKHSMALLEIDRKRNASKLKIASDTAKNMATIFGEETEAGKFFASAQAAIDTYASATAAYNAMAGIPVIGPALGAIAAAAAIATGLRTVAQIQGVDTNFYTGGYTGDGGTFEKRGQVHAGEVVFSQADVQQLGGAAKVESMRPTSDVFNEMPSGVMQGGDDNAAMLAAMIGEAVERGSKAGTSLGVIEAEDDKIVKERSRF